MVNWIGQPPVECELCEEKIEKCFFDCYVPTQGTWAFICEKCFKLTKAQLGTGFGQKYERKSPEEDFMKTEG